MIKWLWNGLILFDQAFNWLLSPVLNRFVKGEGHRFGNPDETLSSVFGKNARTKTCRACNWICKYILHPLDHDHCERSIEADEESGPRW